MSKDENSLISRWRRNFLAGLAITLPAIISVAVVVWLFTNVAALTDGLLLFLPRKLTHEPGDNGKMYWYWSCFAFVFAMFLICLIGRIARDYVGRKAIALAG